MHHDDHHANGHSATLPAPSLSERLAVAEKAYVSVSEQLNRERARTTHLIGCITRICREVGVDVGPLDAEDFDTAKSFTTASNSSYHVNFPAAPIH